MSVLDRFQLDGQVAVVTGASSGLGVAFAVALAQAGADVVLAGRREERLRETALLVEAEGRRAVPVATDVTDPTACTTLAQTAMEHLGRIDVLVNNAGVGTAHPATRETPEQFREVLATNLEGAYWMAQACGRVMRPGSSIVNISSVIGLRPQPLPQAAYASSKAALIGLTRDLANQWTRRKGIRVNAIAPGFFETEISDGYAPGYVDTQLERVAVGRQGDPEEVAATLVWLASSAAGYVTGQTVVVDGGYVIG